MLTKCRVSDKLTVTRETDGRKESFSVMWVTPRGRLAGAYFERCPKNKHLARMVDGPYYLTVLKHPKRKPRRIALSTVATTYDVMKDGTVQVRDLSTMQQIEVSNKLEQDQSKTVLDLAAMKRGFNANSSTTKR